MDEKIKVFFKEIVRYINSSIYDQELMKKSIKFMCKYPNYEWYNIAAILLQNPSAEMVMSVSAFRKECDDISLIPKRGKRAYRVAVLNLENSGPVFKLMPVFDVGDMNKKITVNSPLPLRTVVEQLGGSINVLTVINKYTSLEKVVLSLIDSDYKGFISKDELIKNRDGIKNCVMFSLGRVFNIDPDKDICLKKTDEGTGTYSYIKYLISIFPEKLAAVVEVLKSKAVEEERIKKLNSIFDRNIKQRVIDAKSKVISELNRNDEDLIPPPEDDSYIYEGDCDLW